MSSDCLVHPERWRGCIEIGRRGGEGLNKPIMSEFWRAGRGQFMFSDFFSHPDRSRGCWEVHSVVFGSPQ
jgi:hypothetical protein